MQENIHVLLLFTDRYRCSIHGVVYNVTCWTGHKFWYLEERIHPITKLIWPAIQTSNSIDCITLTIQVYIYKYTQKIWIHMLPDHIHSNEWVAMNCNFTNIRLQNQLYFSIQHVCNLKQIWRLVSIKR